MSRPIVLGFVGDSAAGKTTLTKGIAQVLGQDDVTVICTDDYHRYDRHQRAELGISALHPDCNYLDIMEQHFALLRAGQPILKPIYNHHTGEFDPPEYIKPSKFVVLEGLLGYTTREMREHYDVKVYLAPLNLCGGTGRSSGIRASAVTARKRCSQPWQSANQTQSNLFVPSASGQIWW